MRNPNDFWEELIKYAKPESTEYVAPILYYLAKYMDAKATAEIGSLNGFVSVALALAMKENRGKHYVIEINPECMKKTKDNCVVYDVADPNNVKFILGDSTKIDFNEKLDLLFDDGDHHGEPVLKEIKKYWPLIKEGGLMCFHDYHTRYYPNIGETLNSPDVKEERDQAEVVKLPYKTGLAIWRKRKS